MAFVRDLAGFREAENSFNIAKTSGVFVSSGLSPIHMGYKGPRQITLSGSFVATIVPERSTDFGVTWFPVTFIDGSAISWTAPMSTQLPEFSARAWLRLNCTWTSGTVTWEIEQ